jgi:hypothetical protein
MEKKRRKINESSEQLVPTVLQLLPTDLWYTILRHLPLLPGSSSIFGCFISVSFLANIFFGLFVDLFV